MKYIYFKYGEGKSFPSLFRARIYLKNESLYEANRGYLQVPTDNWSSLRIYATHKSTSPFYDHFAISQDFILILCELEEKY